MSDASFSFQELQAAGKVELANIEMLTASDGVVLSYRRYVPASPLAAVLFYHGGGAHSGAGYQYLGSGLQMQFDTLVFMPDIRGHGASGGSRGDTPSPKQVWTDITTFIKHIRTTFPNLPIFLGGHSSGAGLILNYISQPSPEPVDGTIFLSPEFGFRSKTARPVLTTPFAKVNIPAFIVNAMSAGLLAGHTHAVQFNYPAEVLASDRDLIASYTVNMANALTPSAPHLQFAAINRPFGLWIGANDELLSPNLVLAFAELAVSVRVDSEVNSIPDGKHLSVLVKAHEIVGPWIGHLLTGKPPEGR